MGLLWLNDKARDKVKAKAETIGRKHEGGLGLTAAMGMET
jgi:hypothetical protein